MLALLLLAAQLDKPLNESEATSLLNAAQTAWYSCGERAGVQWADSQEAAAAVADVAAGECVGEEQRVEDALRVWMRASGGGVIWIEENFGRFKDEAAGRFRRATMRAVMAARQRRPTH